MLCGVGQPGDGPSRSRLSGWAACRALRAVIVCLSKGRARAHHCGISREHETAVRSGDREAVLLTASFELSASVCLLLTRGPLICRGALQIGEREPDGPGRC